MPAYHTYAARVDAQEAAHPRKAKAKACAPANAGRQPCIFRSRRDHTNARSTNGNGWWTTASHASPTTRYQSRRASRPESVPDRWCHPVIVTAASTTARIAGVWLAAPYA